MMRIRYRAATVILSAIILALMAVLPAQAQSKAQSKAQMTAKPLKRDVFEVRNVAVDVTAETAAKARKKALAMGEREAFRRLVERLTLSAERKGGAVSIPEDISALVGDFQVLEEKTSTVRYLATLVYRFKPRLVRKYFVDSYMAFAETPSKPVLVLPVFQAAGAQLLFDDPNPWRDAWAARTDNGGLVPLTLPKGDLEDISLIGAEQAVNGDMQRLSAIARRYGAGDTLVVQAIQGMDSRGLATLEVFMTRYGTVQVEQTVVKSYAIRSGETVAGLLRRAADDLARRVEDNWKRDNLLEFGRQAVIAVRLPISGLENWVGLKRTLAGIAVIRRADLVLLSRNEAIVNIHYIGDPDQLSLALEQEDLILDREDGEWTITPAAGALEMPGKKS